MVTDETLAPQTAAAVIERIQVQDLTEQELEKLPFGAIQLDTAGRILPFNGFESQISGVSKEQAVGKLFFTEIAPCTNVKESCGRLKKV
jgi:photoactive yellow protein